MSPRRLPPLFLTLPMALAAVLSGCTRVGAPAEASPAAPVARAPEAEAAPVRYTGIATLSGRRVPVVLEVRPEGGDDVAAQLRIPELEMAAAGKGSWRGSRLTLELAYGEGCPGSVRILVERDPVGRLSGTLRARDCTGEAEGPLALEYGAGRPPGRPSR